MTMLTSKTCASCKRASYVHNEAIQKIVSLCTLLSLDDMPGSRVHGRWHDSPTTCFRCPLPRVLFGEYSRVHSFLCSLDRKHAALYSMALLDFGRGSPRVAEKKKQSCRGGDGLNSVGSDPHDVAAHVSTLQRCMRCRAAPSARPPGPSVCRPTVCPLPRHARIIKRITHSLRV